MLSSVLPILNSALVVVSALVALNVIVFGVLVWVNYRYPVGDRCRDCYRVIRYQTRAGKHDAHLLHHGYDCPARAGSPTYLPERKESP